MSNEITASGIMSFTNFSEAMKCAEIVAKSSFCPKSYLEVKGIKRNYNDVVADILVAWQLGAEVGLKPMQALQNVSVVNGKSTVWGDAALALCRASGELEYCKETFDETTYTATCEVKRKNEIVVRNFSKEDAIKPGLWGKTGPWSTYPKRMLQIRARSFTLRDLFPDKLSGLITTEEAMDYPIDVAAPVPICETVKAKIIQNRPEPITALPVVEAPKPEPMSEAALIKLTDALDSFKHQVEINKSIDKALDYYGVEFMSELTEEQGQVILKRLTEKYGVNNEQNT